MICTKYPRYLYDSRIPSKSDGSLYHFTSKKGFFDILEDLTFLPSSFNKLNDLNEGNVYNIRMDKNFGVIYGADTYIKQHCHVLCFSQNYDIEGLHCEGTNHPAMWAHYAENTNGACIVIDKDAFIEKNKQILDKYFYKFESVKYGLLNAPMDDEINFNANNPQEFIKNNWKPLFFRKHRDWEYEDEYRLFIMDYDGKFSIDGCIKHIVLGEKFLKDKTTKDETNMKRLFDLIVDPSSTCYKKFFPHSFACSLHSINGYFTDEIAGQIIMNLNANKNDERYLNYLKWLNEENGYQLGQF